MERQHLIDGLLHRSGLFLGDLTIVDGDGELFPLDERPGDPAHPFSQFLLGPAEHGEEIGSLLRSLHLAFRAFDVEAVAADVKDSVDPDQFLHVPEVPAADDRHGAAAGKLDHRLARLFGKNRQFRAADDGRQRAVIVEKNGDALSLRALFQLFDTLQGRGERLGADLGGRFLIAHRQPPQDHSPRRRLHSPAGPRPVRFCPLR